MRLNTHQNKQEVEIHCSIVKETDNQSNSDTATQIKISVMDHGSGIPSQFHEQIFKKFMQADSSDTKKIGGTGLGLAISRELIQNMNGHIDFDPDYKNGAHFLYLFTHRI